MAAPQKNGFLLVHGMSYVHVSGPLLHVEIDPVLHVVIVPYVKKSNSITCMESIMAYYGEKIEIAVEALGATRRSSLDSSISCKVQEFRLENL